LFHQLVEAVKEPSVQRSGFERYAEPAPPRFTATFRTFCGT
jgi:hypothetical protein